MPNLGHPHNSLLVAELLPGVVEEPGVAKEATGGLWTGLSGFQVIALWRWCRQADASLGPRS